MSRSKTRKVLERSLRLLATGSFLSLASQPAIAETIQVKRSLYNIQTLQGSFSSNQSILESTPWWGFIGDAQAFANAWINSGAIITGTTYFGYAVAPTLSGSGVQSYGVTSRGSFFYANANSPSTASPEKYAFAQLVQPELIRVSGNYMAGAGNNVSSNLGRSLLPSFEGGTLTVDQPGATIIQNFTLDGSSTNAIDANGNDAVFSGIVSDVSSGTTG